MFDVLKWLVFVPMVIMAVKFWIRVTKWVVTNKQTLSQRFQRIRSALSESDL
jgi:hypothetical protein